MVLATSQVRVKDYQAWRAVYDSDFDRRRAAGVTAESVHRLVGEPNTVLVQLHFATVDQFQAFANQDIRTVMERAGVVGPPRIEAYE